MATEDESAEKASPRKSWWLVCSLVAACKRLGFFAGATLLTVGVALVIVSCFAIFSGDSGVAQPVATVLGGAGVLGAGVLTFRAAHNTRISAEKASTAALAHAQRVADEEKTRHEQQLSEQRKETEINRAEQAKTFERTYQREVIRDLRSRYTTCAEQLAHDSAAIRLAGVYALTSLADDWQQQNERDEKQVAIDLLCAYLRTPNTHTPQLIAEGLPDTGELEVRKTILLTLHTRSMLEASDPKSWKDFDCSPANADLIGANLTGVDLYGAKLIGANLTGANLTGANLCRVDLYGANLFRTILVGADLFRSKLTRANLNGATLIGANLSGADLIGADLIGANLTTAKLIGANLRGANLSGARLIGADLIGAKLSGADMSGANLNGAKLFSADLTQANLIGADLYGADLSGADMSGAKLTRAKLTRAKLIGAKLIGADLIGAKLADADLHRTDLSRAKLTRANLNGANLIGAKLADTDLHGTDLSRAKLAGTDLFGADLSGIYYTAGTSWSPGFTPPTSREEL